jgi:hypothetical protein
LNYLDFCLKTRIFDGNIQLEYLFNTSLIAPAQKEFMKITNSFYHINLLTLCMSYCNTTTEYDDIRLKECDVMYTGDFFIILRLSDSSNWSSEGGNLVNIVN